MAATNKPRTGAPARKDSGARLAGGFGNAAAVQDAEKLLRRAVLANLLWEDVAYQKGSTIAAEIARLVVKIPPETVANLAVEAREEQKLRHVPLYLAVQCARHESHRHVLATLLPEIIQRPDELTEFLSLYWQGARVPIAAGVKKGLAKAFRRFNEYQLAKYDRDTAIKLRDVLFLVHARPKDHAQAVTWNKLADRRLATPDTWEVALSGGADKGEAFTRLLREEKLGALAFLRNLRNMAQARVDPRLIREYFRVMNPERLLPLNFFAAAKAAPEWVPEIEEAMYRNLDQLPRLRGETVLIVDVSGSMSNPISERSEFSRLDAAAAMAVMAREQCEQLTIWVTAGDDFTRVHNTAMLRLYRGFALAEQIVNFSYKMGAGGIFTRQCLEHIKGQLGNRETARTIIFSDSQDCDLPQRRIPKPFSARNYIVDVSANTRGIAYEGIWTAEISGWSERFLTYIQALESWSSLQAA